MAAPDNIHAEVLRIQAECRRTAELVSNMSEEFRERQGRKSWGSISTQGPTNSLPVSSVPSTVGNDSLDSVSATGTPVTSRTEVRRRREEALQRRSASRQRVIEAVDLRKEAEARAAEADARRQERIAYVVVAGNPAGDDKKPSGCSDGTTATSSTAESAKPKPARKAKVVISL
mmetsp:Transcript_30071/g.70089  ORF Transcript_30071/g.70089 Transcript_30071/m.70089 type:complete len:174 (-) Transcript_30071:209-730(-)